MHALQDAQTIAPERIAAASGGALSAASVIAGRGEKLIDVFAEHLSRQDSNVDWNAIADDGDFTPHQQLYNDVVNETLDCEACEAVANGPPFEVLLASPSERLLLKLTAGAALVLYKIDKLIRSTPHCKFASAAGVEEVRVDARAAARDGSLSELVCLAATIPPVFTIRTWEDKPIIDAGTIDNAPMPSEDDGNTLVLLTRSYRNLPAIDGRTYIYPSEETPAEKIDFTDADALRATYRQGQDDMKNLLERRCRAANG